MGTAPDLPCCDLLLSHHAEQDQAYTPALSDKGVSAHEFFKRRPKIEISCWGIDIIDIGDQFRSAEIDYFDLFGDGTDQNIRETDVAVEDRVQMAIGHRTEDLSDYGLVELEIPLRRR